MFLTLIYQFYIVPAMIAPKVMKITDIKLEIFQFFYIINTNKMRVLLNVIYIEMFIICNPFIPVNVYKEYMNEYNNVSFDV